MVDRPRLSAGRRPRNRGGGFPLGAVGGRSAINALGAVFGLLMLAYLSTGQSLFAVLLLITAGIGVDQILRTHPAGSFRGPAATAIYLFVPVLYTAGATLFLREQIEGAWS